MADRPILITGAGGFVCSEIAIAFHQAGLPVVATDRYFDPPTLKRLANIPCLEGDLREVLADLDEPITAVIHGAALTDPPERLGLSKVAYSKQNTDLLTRALDFACAAGADRFVFLSSMGVFAPGDGAGDRLTEATRPTAMIPYAEAKRAGEHAVAAAAKPGFRTASIRLGNVFGAYEARRPSRHRLSLAARMIADAKRNAVITVETPDAAREWANLPDLAVGMVRLLQDFPNAGPAILHAGAPPVLTDLELANLVAARIPGTDIRIAAPPRTPVRPPMASDHETPFSAIKWPPMATMLDPVIAPTPVPTP
ncbi:MAG: NAD(P)-dependent oxidoreductase [Pseudomonadota bacterium]